MASDLIAGPDRFLVAKNPDEASSLKYQPWVKLTLDLTLMLDPNLANELFRQTDARWRMAPPVAPRGGFGLAYAR